jgi:hypothetical protein
MESGAEGKPSRPSSFRLLIRASLRKSLPFVKSQDWNGFQSLSLPLPVSLPRIGNIFLVRCLDSSIPFNLTCGNPYRHRQA